MLMVKSRRCRSCLMELHSTVAARWAACRNSSARSPNRWRPGGGQRALGDLRKEPCQNCGQQPFGSAKRVCTRTCRSISAHSASKFDGIAFDDEYQRRRLAAPEQITYDAPDEIELLLRSAAFRRIGRISAWKWFWESCSIFRATLWRSRSRSEGGRRIRSVRVTTRRSAFLYHRDLAPPFGSLAPGRVGQSHRGRLRFRPPP